jgi:propanediol dehydratase small subunit
MMNYSQLSNLVLSVVNVESKRNKSIYSFPIHSSLSTSQWYEDIRVDPLILQFEGK